MDRLASARGYMDRRIADGHRACVHVCTACVHICAHLQLTVQFRLTKLDGGTVNLNWTAVAFKCGLGSKNVPPALHLVRAEEEAARVNGFLLVLSTLSVPGDRRIEDA